MSSNPRTGYLICVLAALCWSGTGPIISYLLEEHAVAPLVIAFWRDLLIAGACLGGVLALRPAWLRAAWPDMRGFALMGTLSVGLYHAIFVTSIALNGAALAVVLIYLYPTFVTFGAAFLFKERITLVNLLALGLALVGCFLLVRAYDPAVLQVSWLGVLVGIASAITHAGYVLFSQRAVTRHNPWLSLGLTMFFGALFLLVLSLFVEGPVGLFSVGVGWWPWLLLIILALGPTLLGYGLFTISLRYLPGRIGSLVLVLEAPITTLLAMLFLGERLEPLQMVGMGCILLAAVLPALPMRWTSRVEQAA
jgi:drug/metabolite transporter, DME family